MTTSFNRIVETEKFLQGKMPPQDVVVFEARLLVDRQLKRNTFFHRLVHRLVLLYGRKKAKAAVESAHTRLFNDPLKASFREQILKNFNT